MVNIKNQQVTVAQIWEALEAVKDPEIPVVSVVEMGIVRDIAIAEDGSAVVKMTPTFSGCPALEVMRREIEGAVRGLGVPAVKVETVLFPPWSTDWLSAETRAKLQAFGLAPPPRHGGRVELVLLDPVACPYCHSFNTTVKNTFGATLCKAIYYCNNCQQPFEQFKPL
jgi:ring-1,2-phenylacetyl-CoA epoxidase subunit PaaD